MTAFITLPISFGELAPVSAIAADTASSNASRLTARDHQALVIDYNRTAAPYPADKTIVDLFADQAARTPNDVAIQFGDAALTYRQLDERSMSMLPAGTVTSLHRDPPQTAANAQPGAAPPLDRAEPRS